MKTEPPLNQSLITSLPRVPNVNFIARSISIFFLKHIFGDSAFYAGTHHRVKKNDDHNLDRNDNNDNNCRTQRRA